MANPITAIWNSAGHLAGTIETLTRTLDKSALVVEEHCLTLLTIEQREAKRKLEAMEVAIAANPTIDKAALKKSISL